MFHRAALGGGELPTLVLYSHDDNRWLVGHKSYKWVSLEDLILVRVSIQHALPSSAYLSTRDRRAAVDRIDTHTHARPTFAAILATLICA